MRRPWPYAIVAAVVLLAVAPVHAACKSSCTEELRACRAGCAGRHGGARRRCAQACGDASTCSAPGNRLRLGGIVVNECTTDAAGLTTFRQKLVSRRGNCDLETVMELPPVGPMPDPLRPVLGVGLCRLYGDFRNGNGSLLFGRFQRLAALPDASAIVFEVTSGDSSLPPATPALPEEGIFIARPDGTERRRLGDASRVPPSIAIVDPAGRVSFLGNDGYVFSVSPNSRLIAFVDVVPDERGALTRQLFVLDVRSGTRTQLTRAPMLPGGPETCCAGFADDRTVVFFDGSIGAPARVNVDGTQTPEAIPLRAPQGSRVLPQFGIAGRGAAKLLRVSLPDVPPAKTYPGSEVVSELFTLDGARVVQITNFRYPDTVGFALGRGRVHFTTSADPLRTNPSGTCQLFSARAFGGDLRQVTRFHDDGRVSVGCAGGVETRCAFSGGGSQDPRTGFLGFVSQCDPFGRNPYGDQVFSIRADGSALRQLTSFRGREILPDGSVHVELGGPIVQAVTY
jgi:hypothetical protein